MKRLFTEHPAAVGETYFEHFGMAMSFGLRMCVAGIACLLHGIFPFWFKSSGSSAICELHDRMVVNRDRGERRGDRALADASTLEGSSL
ncbi:DUF6356 family protein [uncultured Erythrobacter sp.]|uniref:DUF6356 family protein n=1 Tax=uncultured Erythrobacter sp. TaxID=263913 RepID=UPI0026140E20|nr:DUF6356 family protein [uncultured Erythrobacter sp.]